MMCGFGCVVVAGKCFGGGKMTDEERIQMGKKQLSQFFWNVSFEDLSKNKICDIQLILLLFGLLLILLGSFLQMGPVAASLVIVTFLAAVAQSGSLPNLIPR